MAADRHVVTGQEEVRSGPPVTVALAGGHRGQVSGVAGQRSPDLPWPVAMAGVVQPRGRDGVVELRCLACGRLFVAARRDARACSRSCAARLWPSRDSTPPDVRRCEDPDCDKVVTGRSDRRFCSDRCRKRAQRRRQSAARPASQTQPAKPAASQGRPS